MRLFPILLLVLSAVAARAERPLTDLTEGPPSIMKEYLDPSSYVPVHTKQLAKGQVLWVNFRLLREMGYHVPAEGMTPAFEKQLLDSLGWAVPQAHDDPSLFTENTKEFFADRYGGLGMNGNLGSGRAASAGDVQIKGIGRTAMIGKKVTDFGHAHGGASVAEGVQEAIWGEILERETPNGANRIVAILSTGTHTDHGGWKEPRALIVRVDPLRPAHFLSNPSVDGEEKLLDEERIAKVSRKLTKGFPPPPGSRAINEKEKIAEGLKFFIERTARQYAATFGKRFFHGATSPSNALVDGGSLDYGTQTAMPDFQKLKVVPDESYFGDTLMQKTDLLNEIVNDLTKTLPEELRGGVPTPDQAAKLFDAAYHDQQVQELLALTGAPHELVPELAKTNAGKDLAAALLEMVHAGHDEVIEPKGASLQRRGKYKFDDVLEYLVHDGFGKSPYELNKLLEKLISDPELRAKLAESASRFFKTAKAEAKRHGVGAEGLYGYMKTAVDQRNRPLEDLYLSNARWKLINEIAARSTEKPGAVQAYIDGVVERSTRNFSDAGPFESVIDSREEPGSGATFRRVFDARTNESRDQWRFPTVGGEAFVLGQAIPAAELRNAVMRVVTPDGKKIQVRAKVADEFVEFAVPASNKRASPESIEIGGRTIVVPETRPSLFTAQRRPPLPGCNFADLIL